ncbi:hypothetical protein V6R21_30580 [Limibacter armeniacum]|uniref:hypothetical protein n=1 Tax=Limibacter armeniacum TaxID=466084 RepID=UPI002FE5DB18
MIREAQTLYGSLDSWTQWLYQLLTAYCVGSISLCKQYDIQPHKGLLLSGAPGIGKTAAISHFRRKFKKLSGQLYYCHDIMNEARASDQYLEGYRKKQPMIFDDLGIEHKVKRYGNDINAMDEILYIRHRLFTQHQVASHFTTNLTITEMEQRYDIRMVDRLHEMVNIIHLNRTTSYRRSP